MQVFSNRLSSFPNYMLRLDVCDIVWEIYIYPNRFSSTIGGNREMDQLYSTSQVSNIKKPNFLTLVDMFSKIK